MTQAKAHSSCCLITLLGPPGAGKGTLLRSLQDMRVNVKSLSTGTLCRLMALEDSPLGREVSSLLSSGSLVSDELITRMVAEWIEKNNFCEELILLDGFPRTPLQFSYLHKIIAEKKMSLGAVCLSVDRMIALERMSGRAICSNFSCSAVYNQKEKLTVCSRCSAVLIQREDDKNRKIMESRLDSYEKIEKALLAALAEQKVPILFVNTSTDDKKMVAEKFLEFVSPLCMSVSSSLSAA